MFGRTDFLFDLLFDDVTAEFLAVTLAGERRFQTAFLSWWNVEGVTFDFTDDIFLLHFAFKPAERAFQRLVVAEFDFCH